MYKIYCSSPIVRTGQQITAMTPRICLQSVSRSTCVYMQSSSSSYHTKTQVKCTLLPPNASLLQFSTKPPQRNSSYFTSILQKVFIVKADEPLHDNDIFGSSSHTMGSTAKPVSINSTETGNIPTEPVIAKNTESFVETINCVDGSASVKECVSESTVESAVSSGIESYIPLPPEISYIPSPAVLPEAVSMQLNALGEPTLESLGLGSFYTPVGLVQNFLESIHVSLDIPWWATIVVATLIFRITLFPVACVITRNQAIMNANKPQLMAFQMKIEEAHKARNHLNLARINMEKQLYDAEHRIPKWGLFLPMVQAPIFFSMFLGLRKMSDLPVESMKDGGIYWFVDLTIADPFYILPLITSCTMMLTLELASDGLNASSANTKYGKILVRLVPVGLFAFAINFPSAVLCYWVSTNMFSLLQTGILSIPYIRKLLRIPAWVKHSPEDLPKSDRWNGTLMKMWDNYKTERAREERQHYDEIRFKQAGLGPIVRTHKQKPTKKIIDVQAKYKKNKYQ